LLDYAAVADAFIKSNMTLTSSAADEHLFVASAEVKYIAMMSLA